MYKLCLYKLLYSGTYHVTSNIVEVENLSTREAEAEDEGEAER